ncbi:MAG: hypothetical protein ACE5IL_10090 [Myxococcota bacterium]
MSGGGWAMLLASWSVILGLVSFCLWRVWGGSPPSPPSPSIPDEGEGEEDAH